MKNFMAAFCLLTISLTSLAGESRVSVSGDLYKLNLKVNCIATSEGARGAGLEDKQSIVFTEGNQNLVWGEVTLAPSKAESRKVHVEVYGMYNGDGTQILSIDLATELGGHLVRALGDSSAQIIIDRATYSCEIQKPAR